MAMRFARFNDVPTKHLAKKDAQREADLEQERKTLEQERDKMLLLDVNGFCDSVKRQQAPLIRLETLAPRAVQRVIWISYLIFVVCICIPFFRLTSKETILHGDGTCGSLALPEQCSNTSNLFTAKVEIPSNTETVHIQFENHGNVKDGTYAFSFNAWFLPVFEEEYHAFAAVLKDSKVEIICKDNICHSAASKKVQFNVGSVVVQLEAQYDSLALAKPNIATNVYFYFNSVDFLQQQNFDGVKIVAKSGSYLELHIISTFLSTFTLVALGFWLRSFKQYTPARHLPQRDWITMAYVGLLLYSNPVYAIMNLISTLSNERNSQEFHFWFQSLQLLGYIVIMVWMLVMSTGIAATSKLPLGFYLPKIAFLSLYLYAYFSLGLTFAFHPTSTQFSTLQGLWVFTILVIQVALHGYILMRALRTWKLLRKLPYYRTRFQQLSFRVFMLLALLLLLSMCIQFLILLIRFTSSGTLGSETTLSFSFLGRKLFIHVIIHMMAYCYLEPMNEMVDNPTGYQYKEGQYVVREAQLHIRPQSNTRAGLLTQLGGEMVHAIKHTSNIISSVLHPSRGSLFPPRADDVPVQSMAMVFCLETAAKMMNASVTSYYDPSDIELATNSSFGLQGQDIHSFQDQGYSTQHFISCQATDTNAMVLVGEDRLLVAFRGTGSYTNIRTDIKATQITYRHAKQNPKSYEKWQTKPRIHAGFWAAYESIRIEFIQIMKTMVAHHPKLPIYVTGHSLGGALATLAAIDLVDSLENMQSPMVLYTFGSPRVGNHAFAEYFNTHICNAFRVACDGDIVVGVPKHDISRLGRHFISTYKHVGIEVVVDGQGHGNMVVEPNFVEKKFGLLCRGQARSHMLRSYRDGLRGLQQAAHMNHRELI